MTHHMMNQMGHRGDNMLGMNSEGLDERIGRLLPDYMTMGHRGMSDMAEMQMPVPPNSIPMRGGPAAFGYSDMGGMFTLLKVRERFAELRRRSGVVPASRRNRRAPRDVSGGRSAWGRDARDYDETVHQTRDDAGDALHLSDAQGDRAAGPGTLPERATWCWCRRREAQTFTGSIAPSACRRCHRSRPGRPCCRC
jgi:hypothetical protein